MHTARDILIRHFGSQNAIAAALGVNKQAVSAWFLSSGVPLKRCAQIERITNGVITCAQLRPDVFRPVSEVTE